MMKNLLRATAIAAVALSAVIAPAQDQGRSRDYRIGAGDSIRVQVYQSPDLALEARVSESGVINYPLVGLVNIGGLTIPEAEARIAQALRKKQILKSPQVNINVVQLRGNLAAVLGQVQRPGRFPLETTNMRVSDLLAAAGGIAPTGDDVLVITGTRNRKPFRKTVDVTELFAGKAGEDIVVVPGDTIFVGKAPVFYIYGEAQRPGPYRVERGMTVMQAIAAGGGITARGSQNRLRLTRTDAEGKVVQLTPGLNDPIQPGDVLFVRESIF